MVEDEWVLHVGRHAVLYDPSKGTTGAVLEAGRVAVASETLPMQWELLRRTRPLVDWLSVWEYEEYLEEIRDG